MEDILRQHPAIEDVAVIGIPDEAAGELPRAYIVLKNSAITSEYEIHDYLEEKVAPYKKLKGGVHFVEMIPRNPSGKILRKDLKAEAINSMK